MIVKLFPGKVDLINNALLPGGYKDPPKVAQSDEEEDCEDCRVTVAVYLADLFGGGIFDYWPVSMEL